MNHDIVSTTNEDSAYDNTYTSIAIVLWGGKLSELHRNPQPLWMCLFLWLFMYDQLQLLEL